jgi:MFS family permease/acyl carrier protein
MAGFSILWLGQVLSVLGTRMTNFALSIWIWQATGRASDLALLTFCAFAATVVFSPIAGTLIDRWSRRLTILLSDAGSAVATGLLLVLYLTGSVSVWHLYAVNLLTGAFLAFQLPAYSATISLMMAKQHFPRANAMLSLARSVPAIFAPACAAAVLAATSIKTVLMVDVGSYLVAVGTVFLVAIPRRPPAEQPERQSMWRDSLFGFTYILRRPGLLGLQGILFAISLFAAMGWIVLTPMVLARTGNSEADAGIVQSIGAVGGVLGGVLLGALRPTGHKMLRMLAAVVVFSLLGRVLLGIGDSLVVWSAAWFFAWACVPFIDGYGQAIWQEKVSPAEQGRVFAARQLVETLAVPVALGIAGPLVDYVLEPAMRWGGAGRGVRRLVGTGPGAGMGLLCVFTGALVVAARLQASWPTGAHGRDADPDHDAAGHPPPPAAEAPRHRPGRAGHRRAGPGRRLTPRESSDGTDVQGGPQRRGAVLALARTPADPAGWHEVRVTGPRRPAWPTSARCGRTYAHAACGSGWKGYVMQLADVLAEVLETDPDEVVDAATPATLRNWTSLRHIQLVVALEAAYRVSFSYDEIRSFRSVGDIRRTLAGKGAMVDGAATTRVPAGAEATP